MHPWGHKSSNMDSYLKLEEARNGFCPTAYRRSTALPTSWFQTSGLQDCERIISVVLSNPICFNLLLQPQETNTRSETIFFFLSFYCFMAFVFLFYLFCVLIKFSCSTELLERMFSCSLDGFLPDTVFVLAFACFSCSCVYVSVFNLLIDWAALCRSFVVI